MSLLDPSSFKQENDGFYTSHGYMSTPSSIGNKPMLDIQDIQKKSGSTGFSVKPEDLIYVSDWKASGANPNLGKRNPSKLIDWNLFGIDRSLFGLEEEESLAVDTSAQDRIARAEGDILREGGDGGGPDGSTGGQASDPAGGMTDGSPHGTTASRDGQYGFNLGSSIATNVGKVGTVGVVGSAVLGTPVSPTAIGIGAVKGVAKDYLDHRAQAKDPTSALSLNRGLMDDYGGRHNTNNPAGGWAGGYGFNGYSNEDMNAAAAQSDAQAAEQDQQDAQAGGYGGNQGAGGTGQAGIGSADSYGGDMGMGSYGGGGETGADGNDGSGGSDAGAGEGHGGGSSSDNDGGHGGGTGGMGGASEEGW